MQSGIFCPYFVVPSKGVAVMNDICVKRGMHDGLD